MPKKLYEESNIQDIASAIRKKNGTQNTYTTAQMANAVRAIKTPPVLQEKTIVDNGSYTPDEGFDGFSKVTVGVPSGGDSAVIQPLSVTQNGVYNPPSGVDGFGPVTVNVDSSSPTPIYPDENCIDRWDFTSETPLVGTLNGKVITHDNTTFDSNGAHFIDKSRLVISNLTAGEKRLIRIVLGQCTLINPSRNHRFVMASQVSGFLWVESGSWGFYNGQFERDYNHTDLLMFSNSELIIHIDTDGTWEVYKNSELVYSPTQKIVAPSTMYIGSSDQSINGFTIEKLEIYRDIDSSEIVRPQKTEIEVIPLSIGSNGVYAAPSGKAYSPVSVNVSGGNSGISAGTSDPISSYGSNGDIYIKYVDINDSALEHTYAAEVTKFKRGTSDLNFVSAAEIDLIFDDGAGGEVSIRDISDFSYWAINGNGARSNPDAAFDNNAGSYAEYNPTPVTWFMAATIPPTYTLKTLRVMQRDYNHGSDVWSSFTLSDMVSDLDVSVDILLEENLQTTDWAGVRQWTDFACNGLKAGGKIPSKYFVKENGSWNEIAKDIAMLGIVEMLS